ncbi:XRE family transcriptional regulator [Motiliproteus sp. MSK22-1]|uniref:helix-turn-helix domain-containing protein n=1 Tax=Motiliproteus sp. MSK22-1 TaxID=1897630 RepID=UPI00097747A8|nr:XRE family transcriptional regulator [Motiliproteus sp. MSK22-1]OMH33797.1 hypothetical protein BGP75_12465 [Motiliproteus sp. MSK22-1]
MAADKKNHIAENLRALRTFKKYSMMTLAKYSGVSKAMISKIERGDGGVSAEVLGKLAEALDVGISDLMASCEPSAVLLQSFDTQAVFDDQKIGFTRRALSPVFPNRGIDIVHNILQPGGKTGVFPAHKRGIHEYLVVLEGTLVAELGDKVVTVDKGDCLFFDAHVEHQLINEASTPVIWILVVDASKYARSIS